MVEKLDTADLGSAAKSVGVGVPLPAPNNLGTLI